MVSLFQIAGVFLRLGTFGFGGPLALIAMMEQECVSRKNWLDKKKFEQTFVFCKLLPGPIAYQMALWVGHELRGWRGGIVAGSTFILPSAFLLYLFAKFYSWMQSLSSVTWILDGMRVGALVIILQSVTSLFIPYLRKMSAWGYAFLGALLMILFPRWEPLIILGGGILSVMLLRVKPEFRLKQSFWGILFALFWVHFKAGAFVFGTGLAIIPVLEREVVNGFHWLSREAFLDALAVGQVTPGPITTVSSFIGYRVAQGWGSLSALLGMYLPGALMILVILPSLRKSLEKKSWLIDFQIGAVPTVIGCLASVGISLSLTTLKDPVLVVSFGLLLVLQLLMKLPAWFIILLGSLFQPALKFFFV